jgi:hypothetical protein
MMTKNSWWKSRKSRLVKKQLQIQPFELITVAITFLISRGTQQTM